MHLMYYKVKPTTCHNRHEIGLVFMLDKTIIFFNYSIKILKKLNYYRK